MPTDQTAAPHARHVSIFERVLPDEKTANFQILQCGKATFKDDRFSQRVLNYEFNYISKYVLLNMFNVNIQCQANFIYTV